MDPTGFDRIEPGALDRQQAGQNSYPTLSFGDSVMGFDPVGDQMANVPGCVIPYQEQGLLALTLEFLTYPLKEGDGYLTNGTAIYKAQQDAVGIGTQQPIAGQSYRVWVLLIPVLLYQAQGGFLLSPTMEGG